MEIRIKPDSEEEKSSKLYNLLRNGLKGKYTLSSTTQDKNTGEFIFKFKERE
ncbi:hypothetical protein [Methanobacterium oryzae]|uniref:hypothetical protein n=1 Tax=Methanobacterium oryzae TaxID=69540 RepID=UPI003D23868F